MSLFFLVVRRFRRLTIWVIRMLTVMKSWGIISRVFFRFLGDSFFKYIGITLEDRFGRGVGMKI